MLCKGLEGEVGDFPLLKRSKSPFGRLGTAGEDVWSGKTEAPNKWRQMRTVNHATLGLNPNPANTEVTLSYVLEGNNALQISIADASGKTVYTATADGASVQQPINVAQWPNGIYMLKSVDSFGQKQYRKFSVQH